MTHFLRVGFLGERARELRGDAVRLKELLSGLELSDREPLAVREIESLLRSIGKAAGEIQEFLDALPSEPLVWTGQGSTEEVMAMLEALVQAREARGCPDNPLFRED
ncbi:MAG: hypothetical protein AB1576_01900 [Bacillota bacterium]